MSEGQVLVRAAALLLAGLGTSVDAQRATAIASASGGEVKVGVEAWGRGDYRTAVERWRGPAVAGDADAQFNLGQAYKLGRGVPEDPALAESWFRRAALQNHAQAADNYGLALFQAGKKADAVPWLEKSAARGEPRAQLVLGTMLFNGDAVKRDYPRAYALMTRSSQSGLKSASGTLAQMDQYVSADDRQKGTAMARQMASAPPPAAAVPPRPGFEQLPPSRVASAPAGPVAAYPPPGERQPASVGPSQPAVRPASPPPRPVAARPAPPPPPRPAVVPAASGRYRVQLGAFRDAGNARSLWSRVGGQVGGSASYVAGGGVTRLQAGPYRTAAEAGRACAAAKRAGAECSVIGG